MISEMEKIIVGQRYLLDRLMIGILEDGHILIEGVPAGLSIPEIKTDLETHLEDAEAVDHIHAWALNESKLLVTLDVTAAPGACLESLRQATKRRLKDRFGVDHATVEIRSAPLKSA